MRATADPNAYQTGNLDSITAVVIGGTSLFGGRGGVVGTVVGVALSRLVGYFAGWSTIITPGSVAFAFLVSVSVGLVFGLYPAARAAALDPVVALHYE